VTTDAVAHNTTGAVGMWPIWRRVD